jgi:tryptophan synthase alpha chain
VASIDQRFATLHAAGRKALIPYLMGGFPGARQFRALAREAIELGADLLEIGVPFTDPLADGPTIQAAGQRSLEQGTSLGQILEDAGELSREHPGVPLVLMSYLNPLRARGLDRAARECRRRGIAGWIVPDRDLGRSDHVDACTARSGLSWIPLVAPTTPDARVRVVLKGAGGFVYLVSLTGVTGARDGRLLHVRDYIRRVRRHTSLPLCVGFGISSAAQAAAAEGVVVGSALLEPFLHRSFARARQEMRQRLRELRGALAPR